MTLPSTSIITQKPYVVRPVGFLARLCALLALFMCFDTIALAAVTPDPMGVDRIHPQAGVAGFIEESSPAYKTYGPGKMVYGDVPYRLHRCDGYRLDVSSLSGRDLMYAQKAAADWTAAGAPITVGKYPKGESYDVYRIKIGGVKKGELGDYVWPTRTIRFTSRSSKRSQKLYSHEIGHMLGLGHDPTSISGLMYWRDESPRYNGIDTYALSRLNFLRSKC